MSTLSTMLLQPIVLRKPKENDGCKSFEIYSKCYARLMDYVNLKAQRKFSEEKMQKIPVFTSDKMYCDQYCLLPGQAQRVHTHDTEDKIYIVLEGEAMLEIGNESELLAEGTATIARAGVPHGVSNESVSNLVLLVVMAPKPSKG